jgi:acyl dehydratase
MRHEEARMSVALQVGQVETVRRIFTQGDFDRFAALSGDDNPIHVDPEFAARTRFGKTVAHGMLLYSSVCALIGTRTPGPGTLQLAQELMFPTATYVGEAVTIRLEVLEVQPQEGLAELSTRLERPDGSVGLQGKTWVRLPGAVSESGWKPAYEPALESNWARSHKGLKLGDKSQTRRTFTLEDLDAYAHISGDTNPLILERAYAQRFGFEGQIIPGGLLGGLFSCLLGTKLPGRGTNWLKQKLHFLAPAYPGEEITATVEIVRLRPEKDLVYLRTMCVNPAGTIVCDGEALVYVKDLEA